MPIQSRAAVSFEVGAPLVVTEVTVRDLKPGELLVHLEATGICHSDINFISGKFAHRFPAVFGHEGIGRVVALEHDVDGFAVGDRVIPYLLPHCGRCPYCRSGKTNHCVEFGRSLGAADANQAPFSYAGAKVSSFFGVGTFSEFTIVRQDQLVKVLEEVPSSPTCCVACGVATGLGAALKTAKVQAGSSVVVFGAGGVGLSAIQGSALAGAKSIIAVDTNEQKREPALAMGATAFVNASEVDAVEEIMRITEIGADYCFECVGSPELTRQAFACANSGWGEIISVGMIPDTAPMPVVSSALRNRVWKRSLMGSAKLSDISEFVQWYAEGKIDLSRVVSDVVPLKDVNCGLKLMQDGKAARIVIDYRK